MPKRLKKRTSTNSTLVSLDKLLSRLPLSQETAKKAKEVLIRTTKGRDVVFLPADQIRKNFNSPSKNQNPKDRLTHLIEKHIGNKSKARRLLSSTTDQEAFEFFQKGEEYTHEKKQDSYTFPYAFNFSSTGKKGGIVVLDTKESFAHQHTREILPPLTSQAIDLLDRKTRDSGIIFSLAHEIEHTGQPCQNNTQQGQGKVSSRFGLALSEDFSHVLQDKEQKQKEIPADLAGANAVMESTGNLLFLKAYAYLRVFEAINCCTITHATFRELFDFNNKRDSSTRVTNITKNNLELYKGIKEAHEALDVACGNYTDAKELVKPQTVAHKLLGIAEEGVVFFKEDHKNDKKIKAFLPEHIQARPALRDQRSTPRP